MAELMIGGVLGRKKWGVAHWTVSKLLAVQGSLVVCGEQPHCHPVPSFPVSCSIVKLPAACTLQQHSKQRKRLGKCSCRTFGAGKEWRKCVCIFIYSRNDRPLSVRHTQGLHLGMQSRKRSLPARSPRPSACAGSEQTRKYMTIRC